MSDPQESATETSTTKPLAAHPKEEMYRLSPSPEQSPIKFIRPENDDQVNSALKEGDATAAGDLNSSLNAGLPASGGHSSSSNYQQEYGFPTSHWKRSPSTKNPQGSTNLHSRKKINLFGDAKAKHFQTRSEIDRTGQSSSHILKEGLQAIVIPSHQRTQTLAEIYREKFERAERAHAQQKLEQKRAALGRRLDIAGLRQHQVKVKLDIQQRELQRIVSIKPSGMSSSARVSPEARKHNTFDSKRSVVLEHINKQKAYARIVIDKVDVRSSPQRIEMWEEAKKRELFGSCYLQEVRSKKSQKMKHYDPDRYLYESIQIAKSSGSLPKLENKRIETVGDIQEEEQPPKFKSHKEMLQELVDPKKVDDTKLSNRQLNVYERAVRASKFQRDGKVQPRNPELGNDIEGISARFSKDPSDKLLQRFLNLDESMQQQIKMKQLREKLIPRHRIGVMDGSAARSERLNSIQLLSKSIHSKLRVLDSISPQRD